MKPERELEVKLELKPGVAVKIELEVFPAHSAWFAMVIEHELHGQPWHLNMKLSVQII